MLEVRFGADVVPRIDVIFPNNGAASAILTAQQQKSHAEPQSRREKQRQPLRLRGSA
jgi:hypothetical protein